MPSGGIRVGYGRRWLVEIVFSSLKRMFGSSVNAVKMENIAIYKHLQKKQTDDKEGGCH